MQQQFLSDLRHHVPGVKVDVDSFQAEISNRVRNGWRAVALFWLIAVFSGVAAWGISALFGWGDRYILVALSFFVPLLVLLFVVTGLGFSVAALPPSRAAIEQSVRDDFGMDVLCDVDIDRLTAAAKLFPVADAIWTAWCRRHKVLYERDARMLRRYLNFADDSKPAPLMASERVREQLEAAASSPLAGDVVGRVQAVLAGSVREPSPLDDLDAHRISALHADLLTKLEAFARGYAHLRFVSTSAAIPLAQGVYAQGFVLVLRTGDKRTLTIESTAPYVATIGAGRFGQIHLAATGHSIGSETMARLTKENFAAVLESWLNAHDEDDAIAS